MAGRALPDGDMSSSFQLEARLPMDGAARREVSALLDRLARATGIDPVSEQGRLDLAHGSRHCLMGLLGRERPGGRLRGYAQLTRQEDSWTVELAVEDAPGHDAHLLSALLLDEAMATAARHGGGPVQAWIRDPRTAVGQAAAEAGMIPQRDLYQMRLDLPVPTGHGSIETRPFRPGTDEAPWLHVNSRAFASHPEQGRWDLEMLLEREREPWFDPEGFLLHHIGGRLAGSCWTKVHHDTSPVTGEIYVISVDPDYQGVGLGQGLLLAGLDHLVNQGITTGMLYVDAANSGALALYRRIGFSVHHVDRLYEKTVRART